MTGQKTSDREFGEEMRRRLANATGGSSGAGMTKIHMNSLPGGQNKSLDELLADEVAPVEDTPPVSSDGNDSEETKEIAVDLIVDSPYQPRDHYDETKLLSLARAMEARGQEERIKVRKLPNGKYELIYGHRRIRAARLLRWETIKGVVVVLDDRDAEIATLTSNEHREDLSDWERAKAYQVAKERGLARTQEEIAAMFGRTQARISQCLSMYALPEAIIKLLVKNPGLFGYRFVPVIKELAAEHPDDLDLVVEGVEQLIDYPDLEPLAIRAFVLNQLAKRKGKDQGSGSETPTKPTRPQPQAVLDRRGREVYVMRVKGGGEEISVKLKPGTDKESTAAKVYELLRRLGEEIAEE